jgi:hypothetical protein
MPAVGIELLFCCRQMTGKGTAANSVSQQFASILQMSRHSLLQLLVVHVITYWKARVAGLGKDLYCTINYKSINHDIVPEKGMMRETGEGLG